MNWFLTFSFNTLIRGFNKQWKGINLESRDSLCVFCTRQLSASLLLPGVTNTVHTASDEAARADTEDEDAKFDTVANLDTSLDTNVQAASDAESSVDTFDTSCGCSNLGSDAENHCSLQASLDDAMFNLETEKNAHNRDSSLRVHKHGS